MTKPRKQCAKCPWKVSTNPRDIPGGYCEEMHRELERTIAKGDAFEQLADDGDLRLMGCHETTGKRVQLACVGWMYNQLTDGNNLQLRMAVAFRRLDANIEIVGEQHPDLASTLPKD